MNKYTTTIIITTWNSLEYLKLCLRAIKKYTNSPYRIIIFDNGSNDGTKEYFYSNGYRNFIYLRNKTNLGTIKALKIAENYIKTKFVVLLDSDSIVSPNWLKTFIKIYKNNPKIKAIGPIKPSTQLSYPYRNDKNSREIWEEIKLKFYRLSPEKLLKKYCKDKSYETFVNDFLKANNGRDIILKCPPEILSGCCTFLDYNFIKRIGGLTNSVFEKYGVDDADRCWRIAKAGGLVVKTRKVYVHHFEGSSLKKNKLKYRPLIYKNNRTLIDLWGKEIWDFIEKTNMPLLEIARKYWLIRELLLSARRDQIPTKWTKQYQKVKKLMTSSI